MPVGLFWVLMHQRAGHHQVAGNLVTELLGETLELSSCEFIEILRADVVRDRRAIVDLLFGGTRSLIPRTSLTTMIITAAWTATGTTGRLPSRGPPPGAATTIATPWFGTAITIVSAGG